MARTRTSATRRPRRRPRRPASGRTDGFTLLELLVVLAVVGLIAAVALPDLRLPGFATPASRAARDIAGQLAAARQQAIFSNRAVALFVDVERLRVRVGAGRERPVEGVRRLAVVTTRNDLERAGVLAIRFHPDGSSDGGEIAVSGGDGTDALIRVNWLTGRIEIDG